MWLNILLFFVGPIFYFVLIFFYKFDSFGGYKVPLIMLDAFMGIVWIVNILVTIRLYCKDKNSKDFWVWFYPVIFFKKYKSINLVPLAYSFFITSFLFIPGIVITTLLNIHESNGRSQDIVNFIFGEGVIISFCALFFTIFTFINTQIIKNKNEMTIETIADFYRILEEKFDKNNKENKWQNCLNKFVYIYDYSIAFGAASDKEKFFKKFYNKFAEFITPTIDKDNKIESVNFQAIVNSPERNIKYYQSSYDKFRNDEKETKRHLYWALDLYISYINEKIKNKINNDLPDGIYDENKKNELKDQLSIYFEKTPDDYAYIPNNCDIFHDVVDKENHVRLYNYRKEKHDLFDMLNSEKNTNKNLNNGSIVNSNYNTVFFDNNIGITRFIVTNRFVIQFVHSKKIVSKDNKESVAAGFISEDIVLIERFKRVFEEYRKQIIEDYSQMIKKETE